MDHGIQVSIRLPRWLCDCANISIIERIYVLQIIAKLRLLFFYEADCSEIVELYRIKSLKK